MLELAFRCLSWVWAVHFFAEADDNDPTPWMVDLLTALERQLAQVERNLSYYFSPNTHLLGEALALYVAARSLPVFRSRARHEAMGRRILLQEAERQILADGGHCERSAHYHRYALDFYLLALAVARITNDGAAPAFERAAARAAFAARLLADNRGRLPHIGDDDGGMLFPIAGRAADDVRDSLAVAAALLRRPELSIGPPPEEAVWMLSHPMFASALDQARRTRAPDAVASGSLAETGYYVSRSSAGDHIVIDAGPHGYQNAGHAHADALSLTLTVRGTPLVIDPGTGAYTVDAALRDRLRSSALHNTVTIDERPQSIPRGPFHWRHTADGRVETWRVNAGFDYFCGLHDGYAPTLHRRHVLVLHGDLVVVADLLTGGHFERADAHWHLDAQCDVTVGGRRVVVAASGEQAELVVPDGILQAFAGDEDTGLGWSSPVYGRIEPSLTLRITQRGKPPLWLITVFGLNRSNPIAHVEMVPVWAEAGVLAESVALRIERGESVDTVLIGRKAAAASAGDTWRVGEIETNAAVLFCRSDDAGRVRRTALVDGSLVRVAGGRRLAVTLPGVIPALHVALSGADARISGPARAARILVAGRDVAIEAERRAAVRLQGVR
jgi:hypothetical protein